jgi:hypothetical protein
MDLPVGNYDIEPPSALGSAKSPEIMGERLSTGRLNMEKSVQKSIRSRLQTPKASIPLSEKKSVEGGVSIHDQNATLDPIPRDS